MSKNNELHKFKKGGCGFDKPSIVLLKWPRSTCIVSSILYHGHINLYYKAFPYPGSIHFNFVNKQN